MNKKTAHWVLGIFDVAALLGCYYVIMEWNRINDMIAINSNSISIQQHFQFIFLIIMLPITHAMSFWKSFALVKKRGSIFLTSLFLFVMVSAFLLGSNLEKKLRIAGYNYCSEQSEVMTFSEFRAYLYAGSECKK